MRILFVYLLFLLLNVSCNNRNSIDLVVSKFPHIDSLKGDVITSIDPYLPDKLIVLDTFLIIKNKKGPFVFQVYNTKTLKKVSEFGTFGNGPNEFVNIKYTEQIINKRHKKYFVFYDNVKNNISYINFNESISNKKIALKHKKIDNELIGLLNNVILITDTFIYAIPSIVNKGRLLIFNHISKNIKYIPYEPIMPFSIHKNNLSLIYTTSGFEINKTKKKIVLTPSFLGQFDFFDFSGRYLNSTIIDLSSGIIDNASHKKCFVRNQKDIMFYHIEILKKDSLIYALYLPASINVMNHKKQPHNNASICCLDWEGKLKYKYILDKPISAFTYDSINNCFYGYSPFEELTPITKYIIPVTNKYN